MSLQDNYFYEFGPFRLDPAKRRLMRDGEPVSVTPKAFDTLLTLVRQSGKTIEKDDLMKAVWPEVIVEENNLTQNITALRKSLGDSRQDSQYIATIPGFGYRFVAEVRKVAAVENDNSGFQSALQLAEATNVASVIRPMESPKEGTGVRPRTMFTGVVLILGLVALVVAGYAFYTKGKRTAPGAIASIAVLPLENLSGDPDQEYFADGMTDALIGDLAKIAELRVISRTSSMHYKGAKKSLPEIARELNVDAVVEGTVQKSGDRVLVRAQLIHAPTDRHLWVETYERNLQNILALQSEIAQAIAREVQIKLSAAEEERLTHRSAVNPKSFDDYLQGRYLYWNKRTEENLRKSITYFESAIKEDPNYALPYAALADCYNAIGTVQFGVLPPLQARSRAEEAAKKALERDSLLAEAHTALAYVNHFNWNWAAAEQGFKRAIELNPNYANAHNFYAGYLMSTGRVEEAITAINRARELDPLSLSISTQRGFILENARRYDEAIAQLRGVISVDQNHYQAHWMLGHTCAMAGRFDEAIAASEKAVALSDRVPGALGILGMVYGLAGRKDDATKILQELLDLNKRRYVTPAAMVYVYIGLGNKDQAFVWFEKAYQEKSNFVTYMKSVPITDPLRSDPRFADLVRRVGLPE